LIEVRRKEGKRKESSGDLFHRRSPVDEKLGRSDGALEGTQAKASRAVRCTLRARKEEAFLQLGAVPPLPC
jgi:hypothetical protein